MEECYVNIFFFFWSSFDLYFQGTKIFGKWELKHVPFIGWIWYFTESIFLKRNWKYDEKIIHDEVSSIVNYPENYWITVS